MFHFITFYLGAIIGSFAYVCVLRLPSNEDIIFKKSYCEKCSKILKWYFNIPLISYLLLNGKSKCCKKKLSQSYFFIELSFAIIFLLNSFIFPIFQLILINLIITILIIVILIDYNEKIIFDIFTYLLIISGIIINFFYPKLNPFDISIINSISTMIVSSILFFLLQTIYKKLRNIEALGTGDILLIAGLTVWTGFKVFLYLLILSSLTGILYFLFFKKNEGKEFEIPFGSALGLSFIVLIYINEILKL